MPISKKKADLNERFRDNPEAIAICLTEALATNELEPVLKALNQILIGQNVMAIAREAGIERATLYNSFGGKSNPSLRRVLAFLDALNVRLVAVPGPPRPPRPPRPKLGRPRRRIYRDPRKNRIALNRLNRGS
jgi:probable addiction module antidote protein